MVLKFVGAISLARLPLLLGTLVVLVLRVCTDSERARKSDQGSTFKVSITSGC